MAHSLADLDVPMDADQPGEFGKEVLRRCRGRPRLTDSDRAQRRLESRKKYDVRRVYLGESHKLWSELRRRTSLSDAGLAEYLILLNSTYGEKYLQKYNRLVVPVNLRKRLVSSLLATGKLSVSNVHSNIFKKRTFHVSKLKLFAYYTFYYIDKDEFIESKLFCSRSLHCY